MSTSVSGTGLGKGSPHAPARRTPRAIALAVALLVAAVAATPARAEVTVDTIPSQTNADSSPTSYGDNGGGGAITTSTNSLDANVPAGNGQSSSSAQQSNAATNSQTTTTAGGNGGTATGGNAGPSQATGSGSRAGTHGGNAYASGGNAKSHSTLENQQSNQISVRGSSGSAYGWNGKNRGSKDSYVLEPVKTRVSGGAAAQTSEARFPGFFGLATAGRTIPLAAMDARGHETAKASPLGGGLPGHGSRLPGRNPFFNLLSGPGGADAGLMLLILLAVISAAYALPNQRFKALRTRTAVWRPLAYVPPIELPG